MESGLIQAEIKRIRRVIIDMYGTLEAADAYWAARLNGQFWLAQSTAKRQQALQTATDTINRLPLEGTPDSNNPTGDFYPLEGESEVPPIVIIATYELAFCLIFNPPVPGNQLSSNVKRSKVGTTETEFFGSIEPWVAVGIPCLSVWQLLLPFMADPDSITLDRVN